MLIRQTLILNELKTKNKELKNNNKHLEELVDYFKDLFGRLVNFIKHKMFGKDKEGEDYWVFSKDLYEQGIFSDKTITDIKMTMIGIKKMIITKIMMTLR